MSITIKVLPLCQWWRTVWRTEWVLHCMEQGTETAHVNRPLVKPNNKEKTTIKSSQLTDLSTYTHSILVLSLQREGLVASVLVVHDEAGEAAEAAPSGAWKQQRHRKLFLLTHAYNIRINLSELQANTKLTLLSEIQWWYSYGIEKEIFASRSRSFLFCVKSQQQKNWEVNLNLVHCEWKWTPRCYKKITFEIPVVDV